MEPDSGHLSSVHSRFLAQTEIHDRVKNRSPNPGESMNFNPFGNEAAAGEGGGGNLPLMRQSSVYSLTFDEFQTSLGKEFGSVNMDELLRSIWSAEETQNPASAGVAAAGGGGGLQRQGSITLPRTLSVRTVEEVWRDMNAAGISEAIVPEAAQRQPTLGEVTLEEFLVRAGVVREDTKVDGRPNHGGFWGDLGPPAGSNDSAFGFSFQQPSSNAQISLQSVSLPMSGNGGCVRSPQSALPRHQHPIFPKQGAAVSFSPAVAVPSSMQLASLAHGGAIGMVGSSPASLSSDGLRSSRDTPSVSPVPYMFNGGVRGRRSNNTVEKVIERRHKRMIKNRESAARSRQRKQAHTIELEEEIKKLQEENNRLQIIQEKLKEMEKKQAMGTLFEAKKRCLRRTNTGPW